jgi:hypothetical protein
MAITKPGRAAGTIPESGERKIAVPAPDGSSNIEIPGVAETGGAATNLPETVRFLRAQRNACRCEAATLECVSRNFTPWKMLMSDAVANAAHVRVRRLCLEPPAPATDQLPSSETIMTDLFTPMDLQGLALPNRIWMSAMTRTRATKDNVPLMGEYYNQCATAGLIVTECTAVAEQGKGVINGPRPLEG